MMARKKSPPSEGKKGPDYGPTIRRAASADIIPLPTDKGSLAYRQALAARIAVDRRFVVKEDRVDPSLATGGYVRGGRVRDPLLAMLNSQTISKAQYDAVLAFRDDVEFANGARPDQLDDAGVRTPMTNMNWPADARLAAMGRVSATWDAMRSEQQHMAWWSVLEQRTLDDYASAFRCRRSRAGGLLQEVLAVLSRRYRDPKGTQG